MGTVSEGYLSFDLPPYCSAVLCNDPGPIPPAPAQEESVPEAEA